MESAENKTPPQAAPDRRPSLLGIGDQGAPDRGSSTSMLAALERDGNVPGSAAALGSQRFSRRTYLIAALGVAVLVGAASFFAGVPFNREADRIASTSPAPVVVAAGNAVAGAALLAPSTSAAASGPASSAQIELAVAGSSLQAAKSPLDKLAASDADTASASAASASVPGAASKTSPAREPTARPHSGTVATGKTGAGQADTRTPSGRNAGKGEDDADTQLVAAMIARLDRRGAKPTAPTYERVTKEADAALLGMVRECASSDLLEARRCRNRVCEKHWGKANACPASRAPKPLFGNGVDRGKPG